MQSGDESKYCRSITNQDVRCRNRHLPSSRYCWRHQDLGLWIIEVLTFGIGLAASILILFYQEREPLLSARCYPDEAGDPSKLLCTVDNSGRAEARDIYVAFSDLIPLETKVFGQPELGMRIIEVDSPPNPQMNPESAKFQTAFSVYIPRIPSSSKADFTVETVNSDNKKAAEQVIKIRQEKIKVITDFGHRLANNFPDEALNWDFDRIMNFHIKDDNFFRPSKYSYEKGIYQVEFINDVDNLANANTQDILAKYKKEFIDIFQGRPTFRAPVVRIKIREGESTYGIISSPGLVSSFFEGAVPVSELIKKRSLFVPIPVPRSYDDL
jgi:hypothetical protein